MLKLNTILLVLITIFFTSCSTDFLDEDKLNVTEQSNALNKIEESNIPQHRIINANLETYKPILDSLYTNYNISTEETLIKDNGNTYNITEVTSNSSVKGYFVKVPNQNLAGYIDKNDDVVTIFLNQKASDAFYPKEINTTYYFIKEFNLTNNSQYQETGLNPYNEPYGETGNRRFWGSEASNCQNEYVGGGCQMTFCDYTFYVFWIEVEHLSHIPSGQMQC